MGGGANGERHGGVVVDGARVDPFPPTLTLTWHPHFSRFDTREK